MSSELGVKILEEKHVSNPIALKYLEKVIKSIESSPGSVSMLLHKTMEYLRAYSKLDPDKAESLEHELQAFNLKKETIVMIINICPSSIDELRALLVLEERTIETEEAEKILEIVGKYC